MTDHPTLFDPPEPTQTEDFTSADYRLISYATAARIISRNHYLGTPGSTVVSYGMFVGADLAGVITYGTIPGPNARGICGEEHASKVLELTRLFVFDWAGRNAESSFIGASFRLLKPKAIEQGGMILISYADTAAGHVGTIYQATNWLYTGQSFSTKCVDPTTGQLIHSRVASDPRRGASSAGMERVAAPAKHRYITFVGRRDQVRTLRCSLHWPTYAYPKQMDGAA
jgi:hypothetical protein